MKSFALIRGNVVAAFVAAGLLSGPLLDFLWFSAFAQPAAPPATSPSATPGATAPQSAHDLKSWRETMSRTPGPKKGCFTSSYPSTEWVEIPCTAAPLHPHQPAYGPGPNIVGGNANDFTALVLPRHISWAVGSFDKVTGVMSAKDDKLGDNFFSLQINTNAFATSSCQFSTNPNCQGVQQFVYEHGAQSGKVYIEYWLMGFGNCRSGWRPQGDNCFRDSRAVPVSPVGIGSLPLLALMGMTAGGTDTIMLSTGTKLFAVMAEDSVVNLEQGWGEAEFNIFGIENSSQVNFNDGSAIVVRTTVDDGTTIPPTCFATSHTAETNNLTVLSPCCPYSRPAPSIVFTESNVPGATAICDAFANLSAVQEAVRYFLRESLP
jgi:hypothetical protein